MKWTCLYIAFCVAVAITCGSGNETGQQMEELSFEVSDSLLGSSFSDSTLGFTFHPPIGWEQIPDTTMEKVKDRILDMMGQQGSIEVTPLEFFIDLRNGSVCCLSQLIGLDVSSQGLDTLRAYGSLLKVKFSDAKIDEGAFRIDDVNVFQYLITDDERVIFKLLCLGPQKQTFQVDYIVPRSVYHQQIKAIESSIGSFKTQP